MLFIAVVGVTITIFLRFLLRIVNDGHSVLAVVAKQVQYTGNTRENSICNTASAIISVFLLAVKLFK